MGKKKRNVSAKIEFDCRFFFVLPLLIFLNYAKKLAEFCVPKSHHWMKCAFVIFFFSFPLTKID